jgi:hypothetical protein
MARDRLAAMRVRSIHIQVFIFIILVLNHNIRRNRATLARVLCHSFLLLQPTDTVFRNSYPTQASGGEYQSRRPYQQDSRSYEMADVTNSKTHLASATPPPGDMPAFYAEVSRRRRCHILPLTYYIMHRFPLFRTLCGHSMTMLLKSVTSTHGH